MERIVKAAEASGCLEHYAEISRADIERENVQGVWCAVLDLPVSDCMLRPV
jgi:hypothetical protein